MKDVRKILFENGVNQYRFKTILFIALLWAFVDSVVVLTFNTLPGKDKLKPLLLREAIVFAMSLVMGYLLVVSLKKLFRNYSLWLAYLVKSFILVGAAIVMYLLLYAVNSVSILGITLESVFASFYYQIFHLNLLLQKTIYWIILFIATQLILEINEKYSPGVFLDIFLGKYIHPKTEKRILMFIDLKDSTAIAEKLESKKYFRFIREFIYQVSTALIEYGGIIYQYVGDEIVVSWHYSRGNVQNCLKALRASRRNIQRNSNHFKRRYGFIPEFRVGVHVGFVTVGEIGVIKKDLAMSGDAMNTAARIRSATTELNQNVIASKDFIEKAHLKNGQIKGLGKVELKGKENEVELYALNL
jgi:adenylate cyclase